jgi:tetratricopeptide (TPR) repeat protein
LNDILRDYAGKPSIKALDPKTTDYYKVMCCLSPKERHKLLRSYITSEKVEINVAHIYLAQLLKLGYIDYVLTVNFDDLMLRASALFNFIPPTYDIAILKDFTTDTVQEQSVIYLHGQHHGFWLLNTGDELDKVKESTKRIFDTICRDRTWIVVGYGGQDGVFDKIAGLGSFNNDLYWVGYRDNPPASNVQEELLKKQNTNAYLVSGYDADSFFLKLHAEIVRFEKNDSKVDSGSMRPAPLDTPDIFIKPFSFLDSIIQKIKDVDASKTNPSEHQELYENVKQRLQTAQNWVRDAINVYEQNITEDVLSAKQLVIDKFKQEIIEARVKGDYKNTINFINQFTELNCPEELQEPLAQLSNSWGLDLFYRAERNNNDTLYLKSIEKYRQAIEFRPDYAAAFFNCGSALLQMSKTRPAKDRTVLYAEAERILQNGISLDGNTYNLACCYALQNRKTEALKHLKDSVSKKFASKASVLKDDDWKDFLEDEDFKKLLEKY